MLKGNVPWNKGKKTGQIVWNKGKADIYSEETKEKMRIKKLGTFHSEETKKKQSISHKGKTTWNKGLTKETDERVARSYIYRNKS